MIVVTGATGFVGNVLLRSLVAGGVTGLRALARGGGSTAAIADLDVEVVEADVRRYDSLVAAFRGADVVYHLAGIVSIARSGIRELRETNVEGTRNVLAACREARVGRLVYTSSVHAFVEAQRGTCLEETHTIDPDRVCGPYAKTKAEATLLVSEAARQGMDAVVVFPSGIIGPHDFRPSLLGELVLACTQGRLRAYVQGGYNFVDVRDVAHGLMAAAEKACPGDGYILSGHEIAVPDLLQTIDVASGNSTRRLRLPFGLTRALSFLLPAYYWMTRERPLFTTYSLDVVSSNCSMSHERAARQLGFSPRPLPETIEDTVSWFRQQRRLCGP